MNMKNDVAFSVKNRRVVINKHQSTVNPNLPLRKLMYVAREYEAIVDVRDRYRSRLVKIPTPEFITFYNGVDEYPEDQILRLSDYLRERGSEVINMLMAEYDYQTDIDVHRKDAHAEGLTEGAWHEEKEQVRKKPAKGKSLETIADELEEDLSVIQMLINEVKKEGSSNS